MNQTKILIPGLHTYAMMTDGFWVHTLGYVFDELEALGLSMPIPKPASKKRGRPRKDPMENKPSRPRGHPRKNS